MNKTVQETIDFFDTLNSNALNCNYKIVVCPAFTSLHIAKEKTLHSKISIGAQNCFWEDKGAFTGEISAHMLASLGVEYVIVGHSERRNYFLEDNEIVNKKINSVLQNNMKAVLCLGEGIDSRLEGNAVEFVISQLKECLYGIRENSMKNIIIAYEPVWSIGTGKAINPEDAEEICVHIRKFLSKKYNDTIANETLILYGGSLNSQNIENFLQLENINGGLIGGASLNATQFLELIKQ